MDELLPEDQLPTGFAYPAELIRRVLTDDLDVGSSWQLLTGKWLVVRNVGLRTRFPKRRLVPFARRSGNDDVACWDVMDGMRVHVVHDFAAPGWEQREAYEDYSQWSLAALREEEFDE